MKKSANESENDGPNLYLRLFNDRVKASDKISLESIENLFTNMTNLHNTVGKSYEHVATVLGTLLNQLKQQKGTEEEKDQLYELKLKQANAKIEESQKELIQSKERVVLLGKELEQRDRTIQSLRSEIEQLKKKMLTMSSEPPKKVIEKKIERLPFENTNSELQPEETSLDYRMNRNEDSRSRGSDSGTKRRKNDEMPPNSFQYMAQEQKDQDDEANMEGNLEIDKFKFRKLFKKVKKTNEGTEVPSENNQQYSISIHEGQKSKINETLENIPEEMLRPDTDTENNEDDLKNLLNNFNQTKNADKKSNAQGGLNIQQQANKRIYSEPNMTNDSGKKITKEKIKDSKIYKKDNNFVFTQQGVINDSLERELFPEFGDVPNLPITTKDRGSQIMQKMIKANQKRNNGTLNHFFKTETQSTRLTEASEINKENIKEDFPDEKPTRGTHRTKAERENLQGFDCDQCQKFYNFIADGTKIKSASNMCDKCSRHRDKFPLPSTPENFYKNFSLDSQDM